MALYKSEIDIEAGIDEVARGCLADLYYKVAVICLELDNSIEHPVLKDSKKLSKKGEYLKNYIEETAIDFSIAYEDNNTIDSINILNATHSLHRL